MYSRGIPGRPRQTQDTFVVEREPSELAFPGKILNWLSVFVPTKYVLFVRDAHFVNKEAQVPFSERLPAEVVFHDWFLRLHQSKAAVLSCPDAMFFVNRTAEDADGSEAGEERNTSPASAVGLACASPLKILLAPCCAAQTLPLLRAFDRFAARSDLRYELAADLALHAVAQRALPHRFPSDVLLKVEREGAWEQFNREGGLRAYLEYLDRNVTEPGAACSFLHLGAWRVRVLCEEEEDMRTEKQPTRAHVQGLWLALPPNPGDYLQDRYGPDFLRAARAPACRAADAALPAATDAQPELRPKYLHPAAAARASRCPPAPLLAAPSPPDGPW